MDGKRVLVIDDDVDTRILMEKVLSHEGYQVLLAKTGFDGIKIFEEEECDIVLVDFSLPDIDGVEVARILREKKGSSFPLIAMTAHSEEVIQSRYPEALKIFTGFCIKPFTFQSLLSLLQKYLL